MMTMDNAIIDSDVTESVLKKSLKQNVISNHKTSHVFDAFFQNPEISSSDDSASKRKSLEQLTEEHPSKTPSIQTSHGIVTLKTTQIKETSNHTVPLELKKKSLKETRKWNNYFNTKDIQTPLLESLPKTSNVREIKAEVFPLQSYLDCELSYLNNKIDTFSEHVNTIWNYVTELPEMSSIETSNINFLPSELTSNNETIKSLIFDKGANLNIGATWKQKQVVNKINQQNKPPALSKMKNAN